MTFFDDTSIPTQPYPELREVLRRFVDAMQAELVDNLIGIYLVGSLASGDFDADSDIDFLVVLQTGLTDANRKALEAIQRELYTINCYPAKHLEGSFIAIDDLTDGRTVGETRLDYFDNGSTTLERSVHDNQWHVRWVLRERGISLLGPPPATLLPAIPPEALANEMKIKMDVIKTLFADDIHQPLSFLNSRFGQPFIVLTYCRILHTLHTGTVKSKKAGAAWARQCVEPRWVPLIDQAWTEREGVRFGVKIGQRAALPVLEETLAFLNYAIAHRDEIG